MKNEEKIIEILSESLKRQDQMVERMDKHESLMSQMVDILQAQSKQLKNIEDKIGDVNELRREIEKIKKFVGME
jgi:hypothetical protein